MFNKKPKVILLVAGEGKRLRPYTLDKPKCMVEINGVSLIDRQIKTLKTAGLNDFLFIGGYKSEMLERKDIKLKINSRYYETNMVWTLFSAEEDLVGDVIVSYGDIVYSQEILQALINSKEDIAVVVDKDWESYWRARNEDPLNDAETLRLDLSGKITEIGKRPKTVEEIQGQYIGLMKFSENGISNIKAVFHKAVKFGKLLEKPVEESYMTDLLQACIDKNIVVSSVIVNGGWIEVDTVSDLHSTTTLDRINALK